MSAYIYKLAGPNKFTWMDIQVAPAKAISSKVYHLKFWYKPAALPVYGTSHYRRVCDAFTKQELKTRNDFKGIEVNYGIIVSGRDRGIGTPHAFPGEYFGVYQVIDMKSNKHAMLDNIISINDEDSNLIYHKAFPLNKDQIKKMKEDEKTIRFLEGASV